MMIYRWRVVLLAFLVVCVVFSSSQAQEPQKGGGRSQAAPGTEPPHPPKVGDMAPDIELKNEKGDLVSLKKLTSEHAVVLLVLRGWPGYQCPICSQQVSEFMAKKSELEKAGAQVLMVYPGPTDKLGEHAKEFATQGKWEFPSNFHYVTDPDYKFTNDWGLRWEAERETAYPSTIIIGRDRKVAYLMTSTSHGGRAGVAAVLDELAKLK